MVDAPVNEAVRKQLEEQKKASEKSRAQYAEHMQGKPTPTQEENDRAALGEHVLEHEPDGSALQDETTKSTEARPAAADYQTRQARPAQPAQPRKAE